MYNVDLPSTTHSITENLAMARHIWIQHTHCMVVFATRYNDKVVIYLYTQCSNILHFQFHYSQHLCACSPVCVLDQAMQDIAMQKVCTGDSGD